MVSPPFEDEQEQPAPGRRGLLRELLDGIGRYEFGVLVSLLAIVLAVLGFIWIADKVVEGKTLRFDDWAIRALRRPDDLATPIGPRWLAEVGRDMTALGGVAFVSLLTSGTAQTAPPFIPTIIGEGGQDWPAVAAGTTIFLVPILVFTILLRKQLLRGITFGAVRK